MGGEPPTRDLIGHPGTFLPACDITVTTSNQSKQVQQNAVHSQHGPSKEAEKPSSLAGKVALIMSVGVMRQAASRSMLAQNADAKQSSFTTAEGNPFNLIDWHLQRTPGAVPWKCGNTAIVRGAVISEQALEIGSLSAARGEKLYGVLDLPVQGETYRLPMWLINGDEAGPTLVVTGGVHGAEYASIAAALEFGRSLEPRGLRGRVVVVPVLNLPGFAARSIYVCPLDGKNPNRVFPGDEGGTGSEQMADWVFRT